MLESYSNPKLKITNQDKILQVETYSRSSSNQTQIKIFN
jgi:hypothetical protein